MKNYGNKHRRMITVFLTAMFIAGCGGGGGGDVAAPVDQANQAPVAQAAVMQNTYEINRLAIVNLDGSASSDADSDVLTYTWTQTSGPDVTGILAGAQPMISSTEVGTLTFSLVVNDGQADSPPATVTINVLENVDAAYFVDGDNGDDDTGNGSKENPFAGIAKALCAVSGAHQDIYVKTRAITTDSNGHYNERYDTINIDPCPGVPARSANLILSVPNGISLYGGYDANWVRDAAGNPTLVDTLPLGFNFTSVKVDAWFSGFDVTARDSSDPADVVVTPLQASGDVATAVADAATLYVQDNHLTSGNLLTAAASLTPGSSYGMVAHDIYGISIKRNVITAGTGADGKAPDPNIMVVSPPSKNGANAGDNGLNFGGVNPDLTGYHKGGNGGGGGVGLSSPGSPGLQINSVDGGTGGTGGTGGPGGGVATDGGHGNPGHQPTAAGAAGSNGLGGSGVGLINVYFIPQMGEQGSDGKLGAGGGGGGGGGAAIASANGGGGGAGGYGGHGGAGGIGGSGGGASIGLALSNITSSGIDGNAITSSSGGKGATGQSGQAGGLGSSGGAGVQGGGGRGGTGGDGGPGATAGNGGVGGAGGGGPAYGILLDASTSPTITNNTITPGQAGNGASGGSLGNGGNGGNSYAIYDADINTGTSPLVSGNTLNFNYDNAGSPGGCTTAPCDTGAHGQANTKNW
jgi:hypothetical protein